MRKVQDLRYPKLAGTAEPLNVRLQTLISDRLLIFPLDGLRRLQSLLGFGMFQAAQHF